MKFLVVDDEKDVEMLFRQWKFRITYNHTQPTTLNKILICRPLTNT